ncbi:hypothetical protein G6F60_014679 [Rhizopus arrhizus]|nr:hypothetical protein G6F60_014679 [Rhizopus arrhizus]
MNALHLRIIAGIKYAWHGDDDRAQAVHSVDSVRIRELRLINPSRDIPHPAEEIPMLILASVYLVVGQFAFRRSRFYIGTGEIRLDYLDQFDHRAKHD